MPLYSLFPLSAACTHKIFFCSHHQPPAPIGLDIKSFVKYFPTFYWGTLQYLISKNFSWLPLHECIYESMETF